MGEDFPEVRKFLERVGRRYALTAAYLFGSRARGDHLLASDVDLILVSDDFAGAFFTDRMAAVLRFWKGDVDLEAFCYTLAEFERKREQIGIVREAVEHGIRLL